MIHTKKEILNFLLNISENFLHNVFSEGFNIDNSNENLLITRRILEKENLKEPKKTIFDLILNCSFECQKNFSDGSKIFFQLLKEHSDNLKNINFSNCLKYNLDITKFSEKIINKELIDFLLSSTEFSCLPEELKELLKNAILFSDRSSRFASISSKNKNYTLTFDSGFKFPIKEENIIKKSSEMLSVYVVLIDGYIENISEINLLLTKAAETKDNILIVTRGASPDVINTIKVNQLRNSFNISLVFIPFDEFNLNKIKDISIICNNNILLSSKGDVISGVNYKDFSMVDRIFLDKNALIIENNNLNKQLLKTHVNFLLEKIKENDLNIDLSKIFIERLESFNSKQTTIAIPQSPTQSIEILLSNLFFKRISEIINSSLIVLDKSNIITSKSCLEFIQNKLQSLFELLDNTEYVLITQ
jgi:hypothetical protein